jgi:hypothetical protein
MWAFRRDGAAVTKDVKMRAIACGAVLLSSLTLGCASEEPAPLTGVVEIALFGGGGYARLDDGSVRAWGGATDVDRDRRKASVRGLTDVAELATGTFTHYCARMNDGTVACWGSNVQGQLGDGTTTDRPTPVTVSGLSNVVELAVSDTAETRQGHSCARIDDGTVQCWGGSGERPSGVDQLTPVAVTGIADAAEIASSRDGSCARRSDGTVQCWGDVTVSYDDYGWQGLTDATSLVFGFNDTCARGADGALRCWNNSGVEGLTSEIPDVTDALEVAIGPDPGGLQGCARMGDGTVMCWDRDGYGGGTQGEVAGLRDVEQIAVGWDHSCARLADGTVRCWGNNDFGQLGDGTTIDSLTPVTVLQ